MNNRLDHDAHLCPFVQGVQFTMAPMWSRSFQVLVLRDALEQVFGASVDASDWLATYLEHRDLIDRAALHLHQSRPHAALVIVGAAFLHHYCSPSVADGAVHAPLLAG
jgi:hypothetical protein